MTEQTSSHALAREAASPDTSSQRLEELAQDQALLPILASNPATPPALLAQLSQKPVRAVRQAVAKNPNAPVPVLLSLAEEFPHEFLVNPVIPLLSLAQPDFIKGISHQAWLQLLRFEAVPLAWLRWLQQHMRNVPNHRTSISVKDALQRHVHIAGEADTRWEMEARRELQVSLKQMEHIHNVYLNGFTSFALLFPQVFDDVITALDKELQISILQLSPPITEKTLETLARSQDIALQKYAARHPRTPTWALYQFISAPPEVREAVAHNPYVPSTYLHILASDEAHKVRRAVAHHYRTSDEDLEQLARDAEISVREAVARQRSRKNDLYELLSRDPSSSVRARVARNVHASQGVLTYLSNDPDTAVRAALAGNPCLPSAIFTVLIAHKEVEVRAGMASNTQLPLQYMQQLSRDPTLDPYIEVHLKLAANPRVPVEILEELMSINNLEIWINIARNPRASAKILHHLAHFNYDDVQAAVAANKHTPPDLLVWLAHQRGTRQIKEGLVRNPHTPLSILQEILAGSNGGMYWYSRIATHPAVRGNRKAMFFERFAEFTRKRESPSGFWLAVLDSSKLPVAALNVFATSSQWLERYMVALHPATPQKLLETLTHDGNRYVRIAARTMLTTTTQGNEEAR